MKEKTFLSKRAWLNPHKHEDTGMFSAYVGADEWSINAYIDIWDCSRKISLSFYAHNEKEAAQRAKKLDTLISTLQEMRSAMGEAYVYYMNNKDDTDE